MNNYYVVATAKHTLNLRGKQYKIGEPIPTELTEKEYEFYKDALNVESVSIIDSNNFAVGGIPENNGAMFVHTSNQPELKFDFISPEQLAKIKADMYEELKEQILKELESKQNSNIDVAIDVSGKSLEKALKPYMQNASETEVKPKRPYTKKGN